VLERGEKVALLGPNGSGKTTLIETVAGLRSLADGASHLGHNVRPAYYSQQGRELREEDTVLQTVLPLVGQDEQPARGLLGRFQFGPDEVEKRVEMLSGGERSRLRLLTLLVGDANFLLLDEPTNHLDMGSVEALADALEDYTGTILLVTHDRHLIDRVATRVLEIHDGRLLNHLSAGRYWEARNQRLGIAAAPVEEPPGRGGKRGGKAAPAGAAATRGKETAEEARRGRARLRGAEAAILRAEKRLGEIDAELAEPDTYADRDVLNRLLDERGIVEGQLQREYAAWEKLVDQQA
jgi:ATP-binding cassette, subfamily F, member 3